MVNEKNADLPILDELGAEFSQLIAAELGEPTRRPEPHTRIPRRRSRGAHRVARRAAIVLSLLCLVGGVALAARFSAGGEHPVNSEPATLGTGAIGWELSGYRNDGRLCFILMAGGEPSAHCEGEPAPTGLRLASVVAEGHRFVFGLAGSRVRAIDVRVADASADGIATRAVAPGSDPAAAGVEPGTRWFVAVLPSADNSPATVIARDRKGARLGKPLLDCSLGLLSPACERQIRSQAADALGS